MPISLGTTTITALFLGTTSITSAYLGATQVFGGASVFTPLDLFSTGAQGVWYDPSDLSTMFSDRAGTTPVTAPGQLVGLRLDKSKGLVLGPELVVNGTFDSGITGWNNFVPARATVSWNSTLQRLRVDNTAGTGDGYVWANTAVTAGRAYRISLNQYIVSGPSGLERVKAYWFNGTAGVGGPINVGTISSNAISFVATAPTGATSLLIGSDATQLWELDNISVRELPGNHATAPTDAARPMYGVEPKGGRRNLLLATDTLATQSLTVTAVAHTLAFTGTGTVTLSGASTAGPLVGTGAGNRVSLTFTPTAASLTLTVSGSVTLGQLELGSSATAYQKVVTAEDVTEAGVPTCHYLRYDGANNSMSTSAIDFTATDKMSVFAGVRKLANTTAVIAELSAAAELNAASFNFFNTGANRLTLFARGSNASEANGPVESAPKTSVMAGLADISGDRITLRADGTQVAQSTADLGTGNFGNYPLFIGRRNNSLFPFNGRDFGIVVVGKTASAGEITDTETWLAAKTAQVTL